MGKNIKKGAGHTSVRRGKRVRAERTNGSFVYGKFLEKKGKRIKIQLNNRKVVAYTDIRNLSIIKGNPKT